jgi:hypothetical protein
VTVIGGSSASRAPITAVRVAVLTAWCVLLGVVTGVAHGSASGISVGVLEGVAVTLTVAGVTAGWRVVAALGAVAAVSVIAAPVFCGMSEAAGDGGTASACQSVLALPPIAFAPLALVAAIAAWRLTPRRM